MHRLFGVPRSARLDPDILGAIFFDERRIVIDESLDPGGEPVEGRPLSLHAGARGWRTLASASSPVRQGPGADILVRRADAAVRRLPVEPGEGADRMAGGFLCVVPADAAQAWCLPPGTRRFRHRKPRVLQPTAARCRCTPSSRSPRLEADWRGFRLTADTTIRRSTASPEPFAPMFRVSPIADAHPPGEAWAAASRGSAPARFAGGA